MSNKKHKENFFSTITGKYELLHEERYKSVILHFLSLSYALITFAALLVNLDKPWPVWIDSPVTIFLLLFNFLLYRKKKNTVLYAVCFLGISILDNCFSLFVVTTDTPWPLFWTLVIVTLSVFLLDLKWGSRLAIILFLVLAGFLIFSPTYRETRSFDIFFLFSYLLTYLFLLAITSFFVYFIKGSVKQLRHANEIISKANENREKFLADLSHQIRTPLNDIMAFNEMIKELDIPAKNKDLFEMIRASSQNLVQAVGSFTRLGRFSIDKRKKISLVPFDIVRQLSQLEKTINRQNKEKLNIRIQTKGYLPDQVKGDPVILNQVILSLVEGFLRNTSPENILDIYFDATFMDQGEKVIFTAVLNSNPPPPFDPGKFSQLRQMAESGVNAITSNEDLPYLNLLLCTDLCYQLNGNLELITGENGDIQIIITLPFEQAKPAANVPGTFTGKVTMGNKTSLSESNVLLVEDNPINQKIVIANLKQHVKNIDLAENGKQALDLYGKNKYDFILMDIQIPIMDGMLVTRKIREIETSTNTHTPIIAVTANAMSGDREICLSAGMDEYLSKPFMINQLLEKMNSLL